MGLDTHNKGCKSFPTYSLYLQASLSVIDLFKNKQHALIKLIVYDDDDARPLPCEYASLVSVTCTGGIL